MKLKEVEANKGNLNLIIEVVKKDEPRQFEKFGKSGKVCNVLVKDDSGQMKLTLWNDDIDKIKVGDQIQLENGWCSEYKGEKQLSTGKFGKIMILKEGKKEESKTTTVYSNDPAELSAGEDDDDDNDDGDEEEPEAIEDEEVVG